jgi:hypothetical protein
MTHTKTTRRNRIAHNLGEFMVRTAARAILPAAMPAGQPR